MEIAEKIMLTKTQLQRLERGEAVAIPASWDEFLEFAKKSRFQTNYHQGKIIIMGLAAFIHELLVIQMGYILRNFYKPPEFFVSGSNTAIARPDTESYYNGDVVVVKGLPQFKGESTAIITNPHLIVEVLSESTYNYDFLEKVPQYEKLESLQEVVLVDRFAKAVYTFRRTNDPKVWIQTIFDEADSQVAIDAMTVPLKTIFDNLPEINT